MTLWRTLHQPETLAEAVALLAAHPTARPVAGGTDLTVELRRGARPTDTLIDLSRIAELRNLVFHADKATIGALVTHNDLLAATAQQAGLLPLVQACYEVGAAQIRAHATIAGNLVTASPANDTITPLIAMDAALELVGPQGVRRLALSEFYTGVRRTALAPGELLRTIEVPLLRPQQRGIFLKLGLRRAQAISVVNLAIVLTFAEAANPNTPITAARIALGCVAPTIIRAANAEAVLLGRTLDAATIAEAAEAAAAAIRPIDDLRSSADYRRRATAALVARGLAQLAQGEERNGLPERPILLQSTPHATQRQFQSGTTVEAEVNGVTLALPHAEAATLLDALRDAGLTGSKAGCAEGECGSCTVWMNGRAVMACLTPAAQAHGATITTIEGLAAHADASLHPLQRTFISEGAVQCGFCIPGMLMAGAKLLEEVPQPSDEQIREALGGNICRCTGYQKIFAAVRAAAS